jgi:hypothetical protein
MSDRLYERYSIVGTVDAASQSVADHDTDVITVQADEVVHFIGVLGALGTAATADFSVVASATSGGTYAAISGTAITQLVKATDDNKQFIVEVRGRDLPSGKQYIKGRLTVGTAASLGSVVALKFKEAAAPANDEHLASVAQTKSL